MMIVMMVVIMMILTMNSFSLSAMKSKSCSPGPVIRLSLAHTVARLPFQEAFAIIGGIKEKYMESTDV